MTLVVEDANSKLVDVVVFADFGLQESVDEGSKVGDSLGIENRAWIILMKLLCILFRQLLFQERSTLGFFDNVSISIQQGQTSDQKQ